MNQKSTEMTVAEFVKSAFYPHHVDKLSPSGRTHYRYLLEAHVLPAIGQLTLASVDATAVQSIVDAKLMAGLSDQTIRHIVNCVSAIFRCAAKLNLCEGTVTPLRGVQVPEVVHSKREVPLPLQVQFLLNALPGSERAMVTLLARTGIRVAEACGLLWRHVNFSEEWKIVDEEAVPPNSFLVRDRVVNRVRSQCRQVQKVPLTVEIYIALAYHFEFTRWREPDHPVFAGMKGQPVDAHNVMGRCVKKTAKRIGCPSLSWTSLRDFALAELAKGEPVPDLIGDSTVAEARARIADVAAGKIQRRNSIEDVIRRSLLGFPPLM